MASQNTDALEFNKTTSRYAKEISGQNEPLASVKRFAGQTKKDVVLVLSFSVQLYSLEQIINVLFRKTYWISSRFGADKNDVMRTGDII